LYSQTVYVRLYCTVVLVSDNSRQCFVSMVSCRVVNVGHIENIFCTLGCAKSRLESGDPSVSGEEFNRVLLREVTTGGIGGGNKRQRRQQAENTVVGRTAVGCSVVGTEVDIAGLLDRVDLESSALDACVDALHCCSDADILHSSLYSTAGMPIDHQDPLFPEAYVSAITSRTVGVCKGSGLLECLQFAKFAGVKQTFQPVYNSKLIALRKEKAAYASYLDRLQCSYYYDHTAASQGSARHMYSAPGTSYFIRDLVPFVSLIVRSAGAPAHLCDLGASHHNLFKCMHDYQGVFPRISYQHCNSHKLKTTLGMAISTAVGGQSHPLTPGGLHLHLHQQSGWHAGAASIGTGASTAVGGPSAAAGSEILVDDDEIIDF
jgi:hypothetical protein